MQQEHLTDKERQMVQLYIAACFHKWDQLPGLWVASHSRHIVGVFSYIFPCGGMLCTSPHNDNSSGLLLQIWPGNLWQQAAALRS